MSGALTAFLFLAGGGIALFWVVVLATGRADAVGEFGVTRSWHIAAEFATAALLVAAGVARVIDRSSDVATGLAYAGVGALVYAALQSPGYYLKRAPALAWLLAATGLATLPAFAILASGR